MTETLYDGNGNAVSGLVFSILFALIGIETKQFQIVQHVDQRMLRLVLAGRSGAVAQGRCDGAARLGREVSAEHAVHDRASSTRFR